jgi:hypothetical protein
MSTYYISTEIKPSNTVSKVLFWNLAKREQLSINYIFNQVNKHQPDVLAFVEAPHTTLKNLDSLKMKLPEYSFKTLEGAMLVAAKENIELLDFKIKEDAYKVNLLEIKTSNLKFIVTDLTANVLVDKKEILSFVSDFAKKNNVDIIVGDFNTPFESVHFNHFYDGFSTFHYYNNGFTATWPLGIPLFELDHIWISKKHQPIHLIKEYHEASDHALLISNFIIH